MKAKVAYLDGLRGIAALVVVLTHYKLMLYPRYPDVRFRQLGAMQHAPYEFILEKVPLAIFATGGNLAVLIFFVHSGFVLSYKYIQTGDPRVLISMAMRRLFRLGIPIAVAVLFAYAILRLSLARNLALAPISGSQWWLGTYYTFHPTLRTALSDALGGVLFADQTRYNPVFWTMPVELICSYLIFVALPLCLWLHRRVLLGIFVLLIVLSPMLPVDPRYCQFLVYFLAGILLCVVFVQTELFSARIPTFLDRARWLRPALILAGIAPWLYMDQIQRALAGGGVHGNLLAWFTVGSHGERGWLEIGSVLLLVTLVLASPSVQRLLGSGFFQFLGRVSFSAYLVHFVILCSFSSGLFLSLYRNGVRYNLAALLTLLVSVPLIYAVAAVMARSVDQFAINFGKESVNRLLGRWQVGSARWRKAPVPRPSVADDGVAP